MDATLLTLLAADQPAAPSAGGMLMPLLIVAVIFYFIVIRPGQKERKQRAAQIAALQKHDKVLTNSGIYGTVVALEDDAIVLRVDDKNNVRMRFSRQAIWQVLKGDDTAEKPLPPKE